MTTGNSSSCGCAAFPVLSGSEAGRSLLLASSHPLAASARAAARAFRELWTATAGPLPSLSAGRDHRCIQRSDLLCRCALRFAVLAPRAPDRRSPSFSAGAAECETRGEDYTCPLCRCSFATSRPTSSAKPTVKPHMKQWIEVSVVGFRLGGEGQRNHLRSVLCVGDIEVLDLIFSHKDLPASSSCFKIDRCSTPELEIT